MTETALADLLAVELSGLDTTRPVLAVLDGAKALAAFAKEVQLEIGFGMGRNRFRFAKH